VLLHSALENAWSILLIVLFFGGSIFVHELGHFLAARARGVHVEVFSIGFGPPIFSWTAKSGTRYMVAWFPLGGYVLLPQIADLGPAEAESQVDPADLPPISYATKMIVLVAGAAFNVAFAFAMACVVWRVGVLEANDANSTQVGYVAPTLETPDGGHVPSPALEAGIKVGDVVKAIDGHRIDDWAALNDTLVMGSGRDAQGGRTAVFTIERGGKTIELTVHPLLSGDDKVRRIGIRQGYELSVQSVEPGKAFDRAGLRAGDRITSLNGEPILNASGLEDELAVDPSSPARLGIVRLGRPLELVIPPRTAALGLGSLDFTEGYHLVHPSPFEQISQPFMLVLRTVWALVNPRSDIGLSKVSGPVGIVHIFHAAAEIGILAVVRFAIFINVNLAILNLLPIPVFDGGQMVFATIGRLRGRALPQRFVVATHSVFVVLILSVVLYISFFDVRRWSHDAEEARRGAAAAAAPAKP
jgi:regulator of sigma E protease